MLLVGLTGGIGSGKSTVARLLEARGAVVIDADDLARQAVEPGSPGYEAVVREFGPQVVVPSGDLDRARLAARIFEDPEARAALEAIVHPEVARLMRAGVDAWRNTDRVLVYDVPLLAERGMEGMFDVVVTVSAADHLRVARLVASRGMTEEQVRDRMAVQVGDEERERLAHVVIPNDGTLPELEDRVDALWAGLVARARS